MRFNGIDLWLWLAGLIEHLCLAVVLFRHKRAKNFPVFTTLIVFNVLKTLILFAVYRTAPAYGYYYTFLVFVGLDYALQGAVIYELGTHVFRPSRGDRSLKRLLLTLAVCALIVSAVLTWVALPATDYLSDTLLIRANLLTAALMAELFTVMLVLSVRFRLPWQTHAARIAQGLGAYSFVCIIVEALHTYFGLRDGSRAYYVVTQARIVLYQVVTIYWIVTLSTMAPAEREMPRELQLRLFAIQQRTSALLTLLQSGR